jgi:HlyD family secretion protein
MQRRLAFVTVLTASLLSACNAQQQDFFSGYAEADYVRISSPVGGSVTRLHVQRGQAVQAGTPLFTLEQESERAAREEAASRVERAQALLENLRKGKRPDEIEAVRAQLAQAKAALRLSEAELARAAKLVEQKFISHEKLDEARSAQARDASRVREFEAQLRVARSPARGDEIRAAEQDLNAARAQLAQIAWKVDQKTQNAPAAADVIDTLYREGEWVSAGAPIVTLLPPQNIKARFFVQEKLLGSIRIGQEVKLQCDGCAAPIPARISFIAREAEYTSPLIYSKENRSTLVFMVEAKPALDQAKALHPGQPLEVRLAPNGS